MGEQEKDTDIREIMAALAAPFPSDAIEWRVGSTNAEKTRGMALAYVTSRAVQQRLDDVVGPANWRNSFERWGDSGVLANLSLRIDSEWITKSDGAPYTDFEPLKGGLSDAFKRAAVMWGIGRYLYDLPAQWVAIEVVGKSVRLKETPQLPDWAVPERERGMERPPTAEETGEEERQRAARSAAGPTPACPRCGSIMRERSGPTGRFWGCTRYPECKGTRRMDEESPQGVAARDREEE